MNDLSKSAYVLVIHNTEDQDPRACYTLTVVVTLCATAEKLTEMRTRVAQALPARNFGLIFRFDYFNVVQGSEEERLRLESNIIKIVMMEHQALHKTAYKTCGNDLAYVD